MSYRAARGGAGMGIMQTAPLTVVLIAINIAIYWLQTRNAHIVVAMTSGTTGGTQPVQGSIDGNYGLWGPMVSHGEWWRLVTSGFLHASIIHLGSNMLALFFIGRALEPALGSLRLGLIYFVSLVAGSLGVMALEPNALSIGASGAIFGLMGAFVIIARDRGISIMQSGIGPVILINLVITFSIPGIAIGAHLGGLIGGAAIAFAMVELDKRRIGRGNPAPFAALAVSAIVILMVISVLLARSKYPSVG